MKDKTEKANPLKGGGAKPWVYRSRSIPGALPGTARDQDSQAAEDQQLCWIPTSPGKSQARFICTFKSYLFDKGKPVERQGRKAMGLRSHDCDYDSQVAENKFGYAVLHKRLYLQGKDMTLNAQTIRNARHTSLFLAIFLSLFQAPLTTWAMGNALALPGLLDFSTSMQNGTHDLRGVYVADMFALPIVQQPANNAGFVSTDDNEITQFGMAAQYGNVGLLAHNFLSGKSFSQLKVGQEIRLVYGDGKVETFIVTEILHYKATQPTSPYSSFRNVDKDETLTAEQMFKRVYLGDRHVTFQTCIDANGNSSWGRLFVIAQPKPQPVMLSRNSIIH